MRPIYLDHNATTPIAPEVAEAMMPYLCEEYGNPSSGHSLGDAGRRAVNGARAQVADLLGCAAAEVVFTSGGTESDNYALMGVALSESRGGGHIVTSAVEHPAIVETCHWLGRQGFRITVLPVDEYGVVDPADLERKIDEDTALVTVMHANNEVGTIQPIAELAAIAHKHGALMHTDAAQSVGKIGVDVKGLGVDLLTVAGHKLYAPKGIGALYVRRGVQLANVLHGAGQEGGHRPGTENVLGIVGLGRACQLARQGLEGNLAYLRDLRDRLHDALSQEVGAGAVRLNGHPSNRLPNTVNLSFRGVEANRLLSDIAEEVAASAGAACHADRVEISGVLQAMSVPVEWAMGAIRLSVGRDTTIEEVDRAAKVIASAVCLLRQTDGRGTPFTEESV